MMALLDKSFKSFVCFLIKAPFFPCITLSRFPFHNWTWTVMHGTILITFLSRYSVSQKKRTISLLTEFRIHRIQPYWSLSTREQIAIKQHFTLSDIAMAWPTQPSPISCWHVSDRAKHSTFLSFFFPFFFLCWLFIGVIYIMKIKEIATRRTCFTDMKSENSLCWGIISAKRT